MQLRKDLNNLLDENDVIRAVNSHLEKRGYSIEQALNTLEKGIDIIAENKKKDHRLIIEAKGGTSSRAGSNRYGKPYISAQVLDRVSKGFFTAGKLRDENKSRLNVTVCMAFPDTPLFNKYIDQIEISLKKLGIYIFFVKEENIVREWPKEFTK
jgi:hypothetical protein